MITPLFECDQDEVCVRVHVRAPHTRPRDFDIAVDECDFRFYSRPYLLHLRFPHALVLDHDDAKASYDFDSGVATVTLVKQTPGQRFPNLGCLSTLIVSRASRLASLALSSERCAPTPPGSGIQVVSSKEESSSFQGTHNAPHDASGVSTQHRARSVEALEPCIVRSPFLIASSSRAQAGGKGVAGTGGHRENSKPGLGDTHTSVHLTHEDASQPDPSGPGRRATVRDLEEMHDLRIGRPSYGFADRYEGVFAVRAEDTSDIVELPDPDATPAWRRRVLRKAAEANKFDPEHYAADFMLADEFKHVFEFLPRDVCEGRLSLTEKDALMKLPLREYLPDIHTQVCADVAGVLYASCYDIRATAGERNVESAWTISRLAPVLSSLDHSDTVESAIQAAYARSLAYPLYRNLKLADVVLGDLKRLLEGEVEIVRERLLRTLVHIRCIFENTTLLRLFSDIFVTDACIWIQRVPDDVLEGLARDIALAKVPVDSLPWDLLRLQRFALQIDRGEDPDDSEPEWRWPTSAEECDASTAVRIGAAVREAEKLVPDVIVRHGRRQRGASPEIVIASRGVACVDSVDSMEHIGLRSVSTRMLDDDGHYGGSPSAASSPSASETSSWDSQSNSTSGSNTCISGDN